MMGEDVLTDLRLHGVRQPRVIEDQVVEAQGQVDLDRLGLGRLPGDVRVKRARGTFYFPFTSVILMSLLAYLFGR